MRIKVLVSFFMWAVCSLTWAATIELPESREDASVIVLHDSLDTYKKLLSCIDHAQYSINLCPCMTGGDVLKEILEHVDARMHENPNVTCRILIQPTFIDQADRRALSEIKATWPSRFFFIFSDCPPNLDFAFPNVLEMHIKLSVIDGRYVFIGGTNFEDLMCTKGDACPERPDSSKLFVSGLARPWAFRDQDVAVSSPDLGLLVHREFLAHYAMWEAFSKSIFFNKSLDFFREQVTTDLTYQQAKNAENSIFEADPRKIPVAVNQIRFIFSGPDESVNAITAEYSRLISEAQHSLQIVQLYFLPHDSIYQELLKAIHERNVVAELVTNGRTECSPSITLSYAWGNRINYFPLFYRERPMIWRRYAFSKKIPSSSVSIFEFFVPQVQLHKKCMIVDGRTFLIGSYNFSEKSHSCDYECIVTIESKEVAKAAQEIFARDVSLSQRVDARDVFNWYFDIRYHFLGGLEESLFPA